MPRLGRASASINSAYKSKTNDLIECDIGAQPWMSGYHKSA